MCVDILLLIFDACAWIFDGNVTRTGYLMVRICNWGLFLSNFCMLALVNWYIYERIGRAGDRMTQWMERLVYVISGVGIVLLCVSQKSQIIYGFNSENVYFRGEAFWVTQMITVVGLLLLLAIVIRNRRTLPRLEYQIYLLFFVLLSGALLVQTFAYGLSLLNVVETVAVLLVVFYNMIEKVQESNRQELLLKEQKLLVQEQQLLLQTQELEARLQEQKLEQANQKLKENQAELLVSQIQPHFIFNSLLVIRSLCQEDVDKAVDAINHFSKYLRICLDSLHTERMMPLDRELELSESYLYMEKLRFESAISFHKDIETTSFRIPALTIQPLLENAVKHGLRKRRQNGTIWLTVRDDEKDHVITVRDNGVGFDINEKKEDGRSHTGIQNVRLRLEYLCRGTLDIKSRPQEGTEVTIRIPKEIPKDELYDR